MKKNDYNVNNVHFVSTSTVDDNVAEEKKWNIDDLYKIARKELNDNKPYTVTSYTPKISNMNKLAECYSIGDWAYVLEGDEDSVNDISSKLKEVLN